MNNIIQYELPIFSSNLDCDPVIISENMNFKIKLGGMDEENRKKSLLIQFNTVICNKYTSVRFTPKLYDSYDRIVELIDSEWIEELKLINEEDFNYWNAKHFVLYLDGIGMFQFIAQGYEVKENEEA